MGIQVSHKFEEVFSIYKSIDLQYRGVLAHNVGLGHCSCTHQQVHVFAMTRVVLCFHSVKGDALKSMSMMWLLYSYTHIYSNSFTVMCCICNVLYRFCLLLHILYHIVCQNSFITSYFSLQDMVILILIFLTTHVTCTPGSKH